ncbi:uncharacterized protein LOC125064899 [Vanessa atalanta]|uniref:uncharacterized protein LOC125064899 n=1 Tax=Vanessa atalanta TaxID=42275 RepID=UPI001FCDA756|nr:uncharacterized protein LOC125064899 [Vanessa atalanta]
MRHCSYILFFLLLLFSNYEFVTSKRLTGGHTYPKTGGFSGRGRHPYTPASRKTSHSGSGHRLSGGSHLKPGSLSRGDHGYPSPGGGSHVHPPPKTHTGSHLYPVSNTQTGSHGYPAGKGLSGNSNTGAGHTTNVHYHYNYNPPQQIHYTPTHGGSPMNYPVYHSPPPTYVYEYRDSGSKYGTLLAGLALFNLGSQSKSHSNYTPKPGEICKFAIKKDNGDYEETKISCNLISSFIYQEEAKTQSGGTNTTVVTTVTNITTINAPNNSDPSPSPVNTNSLYEMLPNGTLVPINATAANTTTVDSNKTVDGTMTSSVTITTTNTTVTNALDVKGKPINVTPGMQCFVISHSPVRHMKKAVPCGLLQTYADQSLKKKSA